MSPLESRMIKNKDKTEYYFSNETGDAQIAIYHVFPGVEVAYVSVHMDHFDFQQTEKGFRHQYVGFHYCKEGRIEQEAEGEFFYLMPGDCSITVQDRVFKEFHLPAKYYHGISIGIDTGVVQGLSGGSVEERKLTAAAGSREAGSLAPDIGIPREDSLDPEEVVKGICGNHHSAILRSQEGVKKLFTDLYEVKEELRKTYLKIKLPELLFILNYMDHSSFGYEDNHVPRAQVELVKELAGYIEKKITEKISLKDLTEKFGVSTTYLQNSFRAVYGMPVISFIRMQKMQSAARILIHTQRSIDDIADEFGYVNESKFSAVFKKIMGDTPSIYRKEHSKIKIL